ncbi:hypothetical protein EON67_11955, partial [archaeon]
MPGRTLCGCGATGMRASDTSQSQLPEKPMVAGVTSTGASAACTLRGGCTNGVGGTHGLALSERSRRKPAAASPCSAPARAAERVLDADEYSGSSATSA